MVPKPRRTRLLLLRLRTFKADYELHFEHKLKHEPEFVRVEESGEGHLLRQLIDREEGV